MIGKGSCVRLTYQASRLQRVPEGREGNKSAFVRSVGSEGEVFVSHDLEGCRYWNAEDLVETDRNLSDSDINIIQMLEESLQQLQKYHKLTHDMRKSMLSSLDDQCRVTDKTYHPFQRLHAYYGTRMGDEDILTDISDYLVSGYIERTTHELS